MDKHRDKAGCCSPQLRQGRRRKNGPQHFKGRGLWVGGSWGAGWVVWEPPPQPPHPQWCCVVQRSPGGGVWNPNVFAPLGPPPPLKRSPPPPPLIHPWYRVPRSLHRSTLHHPIDALLLLPPPSKPPPAHIPVARPVPFNSARHPMRQPAVVPASFPQCRTGSCKSHGPLPMRGPPCPPCPCARPNAHCPSACPRPSSPYACHVLCHCPGPCPGPGRSQGPMVTPRRCFPVRSPLKSDIRRCCRRRPRRTLRPRRSHAPERPGDGGGLVGTGELRNGKTWYNKSVPKFAAVFKGPKPFSEVSCVIFSALGMHSLQEITATIQKPTFAV